MRQKCNLKCIQCEKTEAVKWRYLQIGQICLDCHKLNCSNDMDTDKDMIAKNCNAMKLRKSTRVTRYKPKSSVSTRTASDTKGRRHIFKKRPVKGPNNPASLRTVKFVFSKTQYIQIGDVVSLRDANENLFYAQIRALLIDAYGEKSAFLTWLIPTHLSPPREVGFDPLTYIVGPDENSPRLIDCLTFVMNAPTTYFYDNNSPYPVPDSMNYKSRQNGFIWTKLNQYFHNANNKT